MVYLFKRNNKLKLNDLMENFKSAFMKTQVSKIKVRSKIYTLPGLSYSTTMAFVF